MFLNRKEVLKITKGLGEMDVYNVFIDLKMLRPLLHYYTIKNFLLFCNYLSFISNMYFPFYI